MAIIFVTGASAPGRACQVAQQEVAGVDLLDIAATPFAETRNSGPCRRGLRYLDSGVPDLLWCEFPTADRGPVETFTTEIRRRLPDARFAFNYSSSFKWFNDPEPLTFRELGEVGVGFIFITLGGQHATGHGLSTLLSAMADRQEHGSEVAHANEA